MTASAAGPGATGRRWAVAIVGLAIMAGLVLLLPRLASLRPRLSVADVAELATTTLQRESREAFVITGALHITGQARVTNVRRLLPGLLDVSLGTVESTVRAPGRVSYGFRIEELDRSSFRVRGDTIEMRIPPIQVYAVEPALEAMEVSTTAGWLRLRESTQLEVQQRATALLTDALRRQAEQHLSTSQQPSIHTAQTLEQLLRPAFEAQGLHDVTFRFIIGTGLSYTSDRSRR